MSQWYCRVGGAQYGPLPEEQMQGWVREARVRAGDLVWTEGMAQWQPLSSVAALAAHLQPVPPGGLVTGAQQAVGPPGLRPHRGLAVFMLGCIGLAACFICGIIAWVMGSRDIREMDAGLMDPTGRSMTQAGRMCGMIGVILSIVAVIVGIGRLVS